MSNVELVDDVQRIYRKWGFLVFACRFTHEIREVLHIEDDYLSETGTLWRVVSESSREEYIRQGAVEFADRPYFYRAEAMD